MEYPSLNTPPAGSIRFNTDSAKMEIYNGEKWWNIDATSPTEQTGGGTGTNTGGAGTRGLFFGGYGPSPSPSVRRSQIDLIQINTTGNGTDFGDLTAANKDAGACASRTRGIIAGGDAGPRTNNIQYVTIASTGNAIDFAGDLTGDARRSAKGVNDSTRGVFMGGDRPEGSLDVIDYITMASTGVNAQDFGDLIAASSGPAGGCTSPTRGIYAGGDPGVNTIQFITISTLGNAADFGDLTSARRGGPAGCSNAVRGLFGGGLPGFTIIDYVEMGSLGNAIDFGDLNHSVWLNAACSSPTRGVWAGGYNPSANTTFEEMDYVQIATKGNAVDYGDLSAIGGSGTGERRSFVGASNGNGGLG